MSRGLAKLQAKEKNIKNRKASKDTGGGAAGAANRSKQVQGICTICRGVLASKGAVMSHYESKHPKVDIDLPATFPEFFAARAGKGEGANQRKKKTGGAKKGKGKK